MEPTNQVNKDFQPLTIGGITISPFKESENDNSFDEATNPFSQIPKLSPKKVDKEK